MKKLFALLLAVLMIASLATVAFADEETTVTPSEAKTFTFKKSYKTTANETPATFPAEVLSFDVQAVSTDNSANPDGTMISIVDNQTIDANPDTLTITIPSYKTVGKYNYTITEVEGETRGVTYNTTTVIGVQVLVTFNKDHTGLESQVSFNIAGTDSAKIDEIVNNYDLGDLSVKKQVTGNLADVTDEFEITVKFTSDKVVLSDITCDGLKEGNTIAAADWTANSKDAPTEWTWKETFTLSHDDTVNFTNIPAGVKWEIKEADYTTGDKNTKNYGYDAPKYVSSTGTVTADQHVEATVTNKKESTVDTGIVLDSMPYILLLAVAVIGLGVVVSKKRYEV